MLLLQRREDLADGAEVIRGVCGRGERGGGAHVVPGRARGDDRPSSYGSSSSAAAGSAKNFWTSPARARRSATMSRVGPFPTRSHTTFGGGPDVADIRAKSSSFETIANPRAAA